jgi:hypothetical protein
MLYYKPNGSNASGARTISGASLARFLRHMSAPQRAVLAAEILNGRIILTDLTAKAVAALVDVNQSYVNAALRCTPEQRLAVASGKRPLVRPRARAPAAAMDWRRIDDSVLAEAIRCRDLDRALSVAVEVEEQDAH